MTWFLVKVNYSLFIFQIYLALSTLCMFNGEKRKIEIIIATKFKAKDNIQLHLVESVPASNKEKRLAKFSNRCTVSYQLSGCSHFAPQFFQKIIHND